MTQVRTIRINRVTDRKWQPQIRALEAEYFDWVNTQLDAEFQIRLDTGSMLSQDMNELERYFPPTGGLFLAMVDDGAVGMIFLTKLREGGGQIRRMYVRDSYRRHGIARALFEVAILLARDIGYTHLLLESPKSWTGAHALYHEMNFKSVPMYPEGEVPEHLRPYWVFMQLDF